MYYCREPLPVPRSAPVPGPRSTTTT
jgi:hypothetical protein